MSSFVNTVESIGDEALTNSIIDRSITEIRDDCVTSIVSCEFYSCENLAIADLKALLEIGYNAFYGCSKLTALILRSETMATLKTTGAFSSTPIKSGTGYIYVPAALVDSYKAASNWSTYANQFRAIEDYPDICG